MKKNLPILTGVRFFAAFFVFIFHVHLLRPLDFLGNRILSVINQGAVGVNVFFILSGFILFYNYYNRKINYVEFIFKRLAKIYPVYLAGFVLCFVVTKITHLKIDSFFEVLMMNLLMIQSYLPKFSMEWYGGGSWSISTEFFFYLCFPILLTIISKLSKKKLLFLLASCFLLSIFPGILYNLNIVNFRLSYTFPPSRVWEFIVGMLVACLVVKCKIKINNFLISITVLFSILFFHYFGVNLRGYVIQNIILIPLMIVFLITSTTNKTKLTGFLGWNFFEYLGKVSYSFYIFQIPFLKFVQSRNDLNEFSSITFFLIMFIINLVGAIILYQTVELPTHKFLNKKIKKNLVKDKPVLT